MVRPFDHLFHPDLMQPSTIWDYGQVSGDDDSDGGSQTFSPGPTFRARYREPIVVRIHNKLPAENPGNDGFGIPQVSTHLHNFHSGSESDGGPIYFYDTGNYLDHHDAMFSVGFDLRETLGDLWSHGHRADFTSQNVYKGLAGNFLVYDDLDSSSSRNPFGFRLPGGEFDVPVAVGEKPAIPDSEIACERTFVFDNRDGGWTINGQLFNFKPRFKLKQGTAERSEHTATLLPSGEVLVAGGVRAELLGPAPGVRIRRPEIHSIFTHLDRTFDHKVQVAAYDFLRDSASDIRRRWESAFGAAAPIDGELVGQSWHDRDLRRHLCCDGGATFGLVSLNGHAVHHAEGIPGSDPFDIRSLAAADLVDPLTCDAGPLDLAGSEVYAVGYHGGLPVAGSDPRYRSLDLPQAFLSSSVLAYVANSGYSWGLLHGIGYGERAGCPDPEGCFYSLNGLVERDTGVSDRAIQPYLIHDSRVSGTSQHGILRMGGELGAGELDRPGTSDLALSQVFVKDPLVDGVSDTVSDSKKEERADPLTGGGSQRRLLAVGVDQYVNWDFGPLDYAAADVGRVVQAFSRFGYEAASLLDEQATRERVLRELRREARDSRDGDHVVFYFAGHGFSDSAGRQAVVTADGFALSVEEIAKALKSHRGRAVVIIDSCFDLRELPFERYTLSSSDSDAAGNTGNVTFLLAGSPGQSVLESHSLQSGVFTHALIETLEDVVDSVPHLDFAGIAATISERTRELARALYNSEQNPVATLPSFERDVPRRAIPAPDQVDRNTADRAVGWGLR